MGLATLLTTAFVAGAGRSAEGEAVRFKEEFPVGCQYHVRTRVDLSGTLTLPAEKGKPAPKPLPIRGDSAIEYDERVLAAGDGQVSKTLRINQRMDFRRTLGDREQSSSLRREVRRMVLLRHNNTEVPFSPDGAMTWGELDLVRTDVFTPALVGMLPDKAVRPGDSWSATAQAVQELTDMERIEDGGLQCKLEQVSTRDGRRSARVTYSGTVTGAGEDGRNRQKLEGYFDFDLTSNHLTYLFLHGTHSLLDADGKEVGKIEGRFVLSRKADGDCPDLADEKIKGLTLEPNADNTLLLYDNPDLGVKFLYPRRWRVASVRGNQLTLDSADGAGVLLSVEPLSRTPTGEAFLAESRDFFTAQKAKVVRTDPVRTVQTAPKLEHFALEIEMNGQKALLDYHVARHADGGVTVAARLPAADAAPLQEEVQRIARSLAVTRKIPEPMKK
jgi:hypothetical protein